MIETAVMITLDDLVDLQFPHEPTTLIRLEAQGRSYSDTSYFFAFRKGRWAWPPDAGLNADTPNACVQRNRDTIVTWSPLAYMNSPMPTSPAMLPFVWVCLPMRIFPSRFDASMGQVDAEAERSALARIAAMTPEPNVVLHEGRRISCLWKLREPLPAPSEPLDETRSGPWGDKPMARVQRCLWGLAARYGGDRRSLDPRKETFSPPRVAMASVYPTRLVEVMLSSNVDRTFDVDELL
jgi:hypothetical protein